MFNSTEKHYNNCMQLFATATFKKRIKKFINQIYPSCESMVKYTQKCLLEVANVFLHINAKK
jgi:hypothetical protein